MKEERQLCKNHSRSGKLDGKIEEIASRKSWIQKVATVTPSRLQDIWAWNGWKEQDKQSIQHMDFERGSRHLSQAIHQTPSIILGGKATLAGSQKTF